MMSVKLHLSSSLAFYCIIFILRSGSIFLTSIINGASARLPFFHSKTHAAIRRPSLSSRYFFSHFHRIIIIGIIIIINSDGKNNNSNRILVIIKNLHQHTTFLLLVFDLKSRPGGQLKHLANSLLGSC